MCQRMPEIFTAAMGNQMYTALCDTIEEAREFATFVLDEQAPSVQRAQALFRAESPYRLCRSIHSKH